MIRLPFETRSSSRGCARWRGRTSYWVGELHRARGAGYGDRGSCAFAVDDKEIHRQEGSAEKDHRLGEGSFWLVCSQARDRPPRQTYFSPRQDGRSLEQPFLGITAT